MPVTAWQAGTNSKLHKRLSPLMTGGAAHLITPCVLREGLAHIIIRQPALKSEGKPALVRGIRLLRKLAALPWVAHRHKVQLYSLGPENRQDGPWRAALPAPSCTRGGGGGGRVRAEATAL